jgi:Fe2+ transport system protein FeoA
VISSVTPSTMPAPVSLAQLRAGTLARVHAAHLAREDGALLRALGLTDRCLLRVCKAGEPCIVQVRETRIGLSRELARGIFVIPEAAA